MKDNPCKYCDKAEVYQYNNKLRYIRTSIDCLNCNFLKAHEKYLESKRKYIKGQEITSLDELMKYDFVYIQDKIFHQGFFSSMQIRWLYNQIKLGKIYKAIKK